MNRNVKVGRQKASGVSFVGTARVRAVVGCLLLSLAACGAPVSEKAPAASASNGTTVDGGLATGAVQRGADQNDRKAVTSAQLATDTDERDNRSIPGVPDVVARDLASADPRDRYRALEHWNVKRGTAPLDAVFEAMEDEDEGVRDKATAIVEQRWAEKQQQERS